jgi:serine/threonine protein kinase
MPIPYSRRRTSFLRKPISSFDEFLTIVVRWMGEAGVRYGSQITLGGALGKGAFAQVTLGYIPGQQLVAVKRYTNGLHQLRSEELYGAALREAIILRRLRGASNVLQLRGVCIATLPGSTDPEVWLVLDYLIGQPFAKIHFPPQATPLETARLALLPLTCALRGIHEVAVHLNLSPDNILVGTDGSVTVIDLNGALPIITWGRETAAAGPVVGKHYYMAPEQVREFDSISLMNEYFTDLVQLCAHHGLQVRVITAVDVFAFGVIAFDLLLEVFAGGVSREYACSLREDADLARAKLNSLECPAPLSDAIVRCLSPQAGARPTAAALVRFLAGDVVTGSLDAAAETERVPRIGEMLTAAAAPTGQILPMEADPGPLIKLALAASVSAAAPAPAAARGPAVAPARNPVVPFSRQTGV